MALQTMRRDKKGCRMAVAHTVAGSFVGGRDERHDAPTPLATGTSEVAVPMTPIPMSRPTSPPPSVAMR